MNKLVINLGLAAASTLTLLAFAPTAEAADLNLGGDLLRELDSHIQDEGVELSLNDNSLFKPLNAADLYWDGVDPVDVFFLNEGAGFQNQLLFRANDKPLEMIFDNVSGIGSIMENKGKDGKDGVMTLGEGKRLGKFDGPTQLSFFINADGNRGGTNLFGADGLTGSVVDGREVNTDGLSHMVAYNYVYKEENYTIIGFEDLWGELGELNKARNNNKGPWRADRDFNDVVFAVKGLSQGTPPPITKVPEPSMLLGMLGVAALGAKGAKRKLSA